MFLYRGEDHIECLVDHLVSEACRFYEMPMHLMAQLNPQQLSSYSRATICHICEMPLHTERESDIMITIPEYTEELLMHDVIYLIVDLSFCLS